MVASQRLSSVQKWPGNSRVLSESVLCRVSRLLTAVAVSEVGMQVNSEATTSNLGLLNGGGRFSQPAEQGWGLGGFWCCK